MVIVSATTRVGAKETMQALALGAVDFITKPSGPVSLDIQTIRRELVYKVHVAYDNRHAIRMGHQDRVDDQDDSAANLPHPAPLSSPSPMPANGLANGPAKTCRSCRVIGIAASTGGPAALQRLIPQLPADLAAGVVIVQHISLGFTAALAERLDELSNLRVMEVQDGMPILPGQVLIAPAGFHATVRTQRGQLVARLSNRPAGLIHCPSADVFFYSIADVCAQDACGVILTGMGDDGARGLAAMHRQGSYTIAQDEASSVVYGMPQRAVELGGVDVTLPLGSIAGRINRLAKPCPAG